MQKIFKIKFFWNLRKLGIPLHQSSQFIIERIHKSILVFMVIQYARYLTFEFNVVYFKLNIIVYTL